MSWLDAGLDVIGIAGCLIGFLVFLRWWSNRPLKPPDDEDWPHGI